LGSKQPKPPFDIIWPKEDTDVPLLLLALQKPSGVQQPG
jgi:hypothetical protein